MLKCKYYYVLLILCLISSNVEGLHRSNQLLKVRSSLFQNLDNWENETSKSTPKNQFKILFPPVPVTMALRKALHHSKPWSLMVHQYSSRGMLAGTLSTIVAFRIFASVANASSDKNTDKSYRPHSAATMSQIQVISRAASFWKKSLPLICHYKFTQTWLKINNSDKYKRDAVYDRLHNRYAPQALDIVLDMKGLFIKIGQVLSSRPDFVPKQYVQAFTTVQDSCPAWPGSEVIEVIRESLEQNGKYFTFEDLFDSFDPEPLGSASIGQVHKAILTPKSLKLAKQKGYQGTSTVAVKVMHLDAYDRFRNDFKIFRWLCRIALPGWTPLLKEQEKQIMTEFNYLNECENLMLVRQNIDKSPYRQQVLIPSPIQAFTTGNVLVMEYIDGQKLATHVENELTRILLSRDVAKSLLEKKRREIFEGSCTDFSDEKWLKSQLEFTTMFQRLLASAQLLLLQRRQKRILELLLDVHGYQLLIGKRFNGDPHAGNIIMCSDGRLGLIDYGQCKSLSDNECACLAKIMSHLGQSTINDNQVADAMKKFGFEFENDRDDIIRETAQLFFDTDSGRRAVACSTPQEYLVHLQSLNAFKHVPDAAVFVARMSFLFRGMGLLLGMDIHTSKHWSKLIAS